MDALVFKVSDAGRAALVNAKNNGTDPVLVAAVGVTDQAFVAAADTAVLPGERKRLTTFSGAAVAADTIHVTIRDDTADVYTVRGFALYLDDGTLFGSYGQVDPIGEKSAQSMFLLATDIIFADIDATALTFGDTNFLLASATTEQQGILELATDAEAIAGTDAQRAVVPQGLKAALDARFGAGAPSGFVKGLLTAATAVVLRAALAIKGAALYDTGTGNGLDADLLDGQHGSYYRAWPNLTGVPATFAPSAHQHAWNDITGAPAYATRWATWDEVTGKPATFPPAAHSQDWATITGKPETATRWPAWGEVTGKPTTWAWSALSGVPNFGTAALTDASAYATAAQGATADAAMPRAGGGFSGGINFGGVLAASTSDLTKHISMYAGVFGWCVTGRGLNHVTNTSHYFVTAAGADIGQISSTGVTANGYNTYSDPRLKDNLQPLAVAGAVETIGLWTWRWNARSKYKGDGFGVRSDEVRAVFPQCVSLDDDGFDIVDYGKLGVCLGVTAQRRIHAADARADGLARELQALSVRLAQLERIVAQRHPQGMPPL